MAQIGRKLDHLLCWILAGPIPVNKRANGEGMPQVMNAGSAPVRTPVSNGLLNWPQADILGDECEGIPGGTLGEAFSAL